MKKLLSITFAALLCTVMMFSTLMTASAKFDQTATPKKGDTVAIMHTNYGDIAISFFDKYAPKGVENFVTLAKDGKYDNTIFHRIIKGFMIQGGDYTNFNGTGGDSCWGKDFENECVDELKNIRGSISYANRGPDTNGSQFFINSVDNANLDGSYTVFGQVFAGMDVVDLISDCEVTTSSSGELSDPVNKVEVKSVEVTEYKKGIEKKLAAPVDPYEGQTSQEATEVTTGENNENSEAASNTSGMIAYTPIIIIGIVVFVIAIIVVIYVIYDMSQKKKKAEMKAKKYPNKKKKK